MYTITLNDGTKFEGLTLSGNTFLAGYELAAEMFPACKLAGVNISHQPDWDEDMPDGELAGTHERMKLVAAGEAGWAFPGQWRVILADYTKSELRELQMQADIGYIAMMAGVEL